MAKEKESKVKNDNKHFMKDVKAELKKVTWPSSKQMVNNVTAVIFIVVITAVIVACLDLAFGAMNEYGIDKIKEKVQSSDNSQNQVIQNLDVQSEEQHDGDAEEGTSTNVNTDNSQDTVNTENN